MNVTIQIIKEDVLFQVKNEAYLTGEAMKDGGPQEINRATKTQASDDDDYLLNKYIDTAASSILDILTGHLSTVRLERGEIKTSKGFPTEGYYFLLDVPSTYDVNQNESLYEGIKDYMAQYTLYKWYKRVNPQMADPSELESLKSDINHRINQRVRPVRRPVLGMNI